MSVINRPISFHATDAEPALALAIRWEIAATALLASAPAAALLNGEAPRLLSAALIVHIRSGAARAELALTLTRNEQHVIPLSGLIPATITHDANHIHIDAGDALHLTVRVDADDPVIRYARTSLLGSALALPGGVYDAPSLATGR